MAWMMKRLGRLRLAACLLAMLAALPLGAASAASAAKVPALGRAGDSVSLAPYSDILEDTRGRWDVNQVSAPPLSWAFRPLGARSPALGVTDSVFWIRFTLAGRDAGERLLDLGWLGRLSAILYYKNRKAPGVWVRRKAPASRVLTLPPGGDAPRVYYLRIWSPSSLFVPLSLTTPQAYRARSLQRRLWLGVYFGCLAALGLYNLFLFISLGDRGYLWYVLYLACMAAVFMGLSGLDSFLPAPRTSSLALGLNLGVLGLAMAAYGQFARSFLLTRRRAPVMDRILLGLIIPSLLLAAAAFFLRPTPSVKYFVGIALAATPAACCAAAISWRRGFTPARFFALSALVYAVLGAGFIFSFLGVVSFRPAFYYAIQLGSVLDAALLSFALADRIRIMRREAEEARLKSRVQSQSLAAARDARRRLADIINFLPDATFVIDRKGKVAAWNQAMEELTGAPARDILGKGSYEYAIPFYGCRRPILIDLALHRDPTYEKEYRSLRKEGDVLISEALVPGLREEDTYLWAAARRLYDAKGRPAGAIETIRDFTEMGWAHEASERINANQRIIFNSVNDALFILGNQGNIIDVNERGLRMFGINRQEASFLCMPQDFPAADDSPEYDAALWDQARRGRPQFFRWRPRRRDDGRVMEADVFLNLAPLQRGQVLLAHIRDITERVRAEEAAENSRARLMEIIDFMPEAAFVIDDKGEVVAWNQAMEGLTGTAAKGMLGRGDYEYAIPFFGRKRPMLIDLVNQPNREIEKTYLSLKRVGGTLFGESHHPNMGGGEVYLAGAAHPLIDAGGRVVGAVESLRDITSLKKEGRALEADRDWLEQRVSERTAELVELNRRLAAEVNERRQAEGARRAAEAELEKQRAQSIRNDRLTSLGQLAAGIAHELNQPLLGVRGLAEHLMLSVERGWDLSSARVQEKLELIVGQADRMAHIVEHVRLFAREAGAAKTELVNLSQAAESAWGLLGAQFRSRGIGVSRSLAGGLPPVEANLYSLEEVILNLMINARDAVEQKRAATAAQAPARVELRTLTLDGMACIQVRDWGAGISPELLPRIFEPFFTTKGPEQGSGLGLAICRSIVERFKGRIDVLSQPGEGTTVTVRLPPARTEAPRE